MKCLQRRLDGSAGEIVGGYGHDFGEEFGGILRQEQGDVASITIAHHECPVDALRLAKPNHIGAVLTNAVRGVF